MYIVPIPFTNSSFKNFPTLDLGCYSLPMPLCMFLPSLIQIF